MTNNNLDPHEDYFIIIPASKYRLLLDWTTGRAKEMLRDDELLPTVSKENLPILREHVNLNLPDEKDHV